MARILYSGARSGQYLCLPGHRCSCTSRFLGNLFEPVRPNLSLSCLGVSCPLQPCLAPGNQLEQEGERVLLAVVLFPGRPCCFSQVGLCCVVKLMPTSMESLLQLHLLSPYPVITINALLLLVCNGEIKKLEPHWVGIKKWNSTYVLWVFYCFKKFLSRETCSQSFDTKMQKTILNLVILLWGRFVTHLQGRRQHVLVSSASLY